MDESSDDGSLPIARNANADRLAEKFRLLTEACPVHRSARECRFYGQSMAAELPGTFDLSNGGGEAS